MRNATVILTALLASAAFGTPAGAQMVTQSPPSQHAVTPADMDKRLEDQAARIKAIAPRADRIALVDFAWPNSVEEYRANAKFIVVLVVAVSHDEKELPLKQVYVRANGRTVALEKIASERRSVSADAAIASVAGRFREDSFYLAPAGAMMRKGDLLIDFAVNRSGFRVYELPGTPPDFVLADRDPNPARGAKPDAKALRAMIEREYPGFKTPERP